MLVRRSFPKAGHGRRGIVLLVVMSMLTLFALVGVGFVIYAQSEATAARLARESNTRILPEGDREHLLKFFLSKLIYGDFDDEVGVQNALRGHALARNIYGFDYDPITRRPYANTHPYSGVGRRHFLHTDPKFPLLVKQDDHELINYTFFAADNLLRDPGRPEPRTNTSAPPTPYVGGENPPYTYPDLSNLFLAIVTPDGQVIKQSFAPSYAFGRLDDPLNANWTNPVGKYMILRPRPVDHAGFPPVADGGGDVKCLPWAKGVPVPGQPGVFYNNDAIWIDLGHPVIVAPDGRKFKPLFAAVIIDLDNKINLNVHGNVFGTNDAHVSYQGWGPHAVNLNRVMNKADEAKYLFRNGPVVGRYGADKQPSTAGGRTAPGQPPRPYAQVDFDGRGDPANNDGYLLPGAGTHPNYMAFAKFPVTRFKNGDNTEATNHPLLFNPFTPVGDDRIFSIGAMEAILRYGDTNSPAMAHDLFRLAPTNFMDPMVRWRLTTLSMDLSRPAATPWLHSGSTAPYILKPGDRFPNAANPADTPPDGAVASPAAPTIDGEYFGTFRGTTGVLGRVNLNRALPEYPAPQMADPKDPFDASMARIKLTDPLVLAAYKTALEERQKMAKEIFDRLVWLTMGLRPGEAWPDKTDPKQLDAFRAMRWLAQLAVNIVDYRDEDDYLTPFQWYPLDATEWVYGTELPRVVVNEAYAEVLSPGGALEVAFWVELLNPFTTDPNSGPPVDKGLYESGAARLQVERDQKYAVGGPFGDIGRDYAVYNLVIAKADPTKRDPVLTHPDNVRGDPLPANVLTVVDSFRPAAGTAPKVDYRVILPVDRATQAYQGPVEENKGFYVIGPKAAFPDVNMKPTLVVDSAPPPAPNQPGKGMTYSLKKFDTTKRPTHTVLLRRLANPHLPPQPDPTRIDYNPYITVDYLENIPTNSAANGVDEDGRPITPDAIRHAWGRKQPYAAIWDPNIALSQIQAQEPAGWVPANIAKHTFFRHNAVEAAPPVDPKTAGQTLSVPFDWLVHLDRQLISPVELLHVSGFTPHQLTQEFVRPVGGALQKFEHYVPWFKQSHRLYRLFEFVETESRMAGIKAGGRVPGRININTIWDEETFQALCDALGVSTFTPAHVKAIFQDLMKTRTPNGLPSSADRPFRSFAIGVHPALLDTQYPAGAGIQDTMFRSYDNALPAGRRLFVPADLTDPTKAAFAHPYQQFELLTKIFNNTTTRSNVFAVWLTVGFFEVKDDTTRPVKLGKEIGRDQNRHIRYRMFAIVDRTQLGVLPADMTTLTAAVTPGLQKAVVDKIAGDTGDPNWDIGMPSSGYRWELKAGMTVVVDRGKPEEEVVVLRAVDPKTNTIDAFFSKPHAAGATISISGTPATLIDPTLPANAVLGHPGPQARFDPRKHYRVVPYFSVIE